MCVGPPGPERDKMLSSIFGKSYKGGSSSSGTSSSGGIGFGMPATKQSQSTRMARTASSANFMALFGPQAGS